MKASTPFAIAAILAACSPEPTNLQNVVVAAENTVQGNPASTPGRSYAGRWTGVEGMFLDVQPGPAAKRYRLTMQYDLDHKQTTDATMEGDALVFARDGKWLLLRPTDGAGTGLKYLADKKDCLTVAPGEGYCRD